MWLYSKHDNQLSYLSNISTYVRRGGFYQHHNMYNWGMQVSIPVSIWGTMETTFSHQKDALGQSDNQNQLEQTGDIFSAEKSDFRGMERLWCVQQRRCIPRKMGCPDPRGEEERRRGGRRPSHRHRQNRPQSATRPESRGARATRRGELGSDIFRVWAPQPSPTLIFPPQRLLPLTQPKSKPFHDGFGSFSAYISE